MSYRASKRRSTRTRSGAIEAHYVVVCLCFLAWISTRPNSPNAERFFWDTLRAHTQGVIVPPRDFYRRIQDPRSADDRQVSAAMEAHEYFAL
jgi:hypothetical protein